MLEHAHHPVMVHRVVEILQPAQGCKILDATFGRGGHTRALLERGATVWALDQDQQAIQAADSLQKKYADRFHIRQTNFRSLMQVVAEAGKFDGILMDLGVSSPQLDEAGRGFSFMREGPLDMRMNTQQNLTAEFLVNTLDVAELKEIFWKYGEEKQSARAAQAIVRQREKKPFSTTTQLAEVLQAALGRNARGHHPATRVFQALRIAVNDELGALSHALEAIPQALNKGGKVAVISFHSLEDRMVKQWIARLSTREIRQEGMAFGVENPDFCLRKLGDWAAEDDEVQGNPRARSARLRAAEKVAA